MSLRFVTGTNVWINLRVGGLLGSDIELSAVWVIPNLLFRELENPLGVRLTSWGLERRALDAVTRSDA